MAIPRVFISSTCYDLHDLRNNLRGFVSSFGYEPVMSEFGDIFFDYSLHVQDACLREIEKCQIFILIIGNNYGSVYYKNKSTEKDPPSVTLNEFKKALSNNVAKHIFINKLVKYDYDNYKRFLEKKYTEYFSKNIVEDIKIEEVKEDIRTKFDSEYYFVHDSYKHIFKFLDAIHNISSNNAILTYDTSEEIQVQLKKQWAGFMYEKLEAIKNQNVLDKGNYIIDITSKINKISETIDKVINNEAIKTTIDIKEIIDKNPMKKLEEVQLFFERIMSSILYNDECHSVDKRRGLIYSDINKISVKKWLDSLEETLNSNKWSKTINFNVLFKTFEKYKEYEDDKKIPYKDIFEFYQLYNSLEENEKDVFIENVMNKIQELKSEENEEVATDYDDELPF